MPSPFTTTLAAICLIGLFGCRDTHRDRAPSASDFDSFARTLFAELQARPIVPEQQVGLFGDLDVFAGESVVMGRYRFRIDTTGRAATAHMAFQVRNSEANHPIPVVLAFGSRDNQWHFEDAQVLVDDVKGPERSPDTDSLHAVVSSQLDMWVAAAAERARR